MHMPSNNMLSRIKYVGLMSLLAAGASAKVETPLVQCRSSIYEGAPVCAVDMVSYVHGDGMPVAPCPSGVTSTGPAVLCEQSFVAAIDDAKLYFATSGPASLPYVIKIAGGSYDFSSQREALPKKSGAIDVSGIEPVSAGCLTGSPATTGTITLSGNPCLIITGAGTRQTILTTAAGLIGISGRHVSHIMIENMTMAMPDKATTQGTYVAEGTRSIHGVDYPTLTLDIAAGVPTPLGLYTINCIRNGPDRCSAAGLPTVKNDIYLRAYTNVASPKLILSTSHADSNAQDPWGYPELNGIPAEAVMPTQPDPEAFPDRWTLTMSWPATARAIPSYYLATTGGAANLICMKIDNAQTFGFNDLDGGGTDIIMNNMEWVGAGRGVFRGVKGQLTGGGLGAQVYNSTIKRGPPLGDQVPCLSAQSGGVQFGNPTDPPIYGNVVFGLSAEGTGDDSIAMSNDIGGTPTGTGAFYPQTVIAQSSIGSSFARDIVLINNQTRSGLAGNSPVSVDTFTQSHIDEDGHCDPLVLGTGNCPVTYVTY
jgi:hypothetical protein